MRRGFAAAAVLAALFSTPASAAHWNVDYAKSKLGFTVKWGNEPFAAVFKSWKADIDFDPADPARGRASVTIDLGSEISDSPDNDDGVKGAQGFQVSQFPAAKFEAMGFSHGQGDAYVANGRLTIRGVGKPVALPFTLTIAGDSAHVTAKVDVMRTAFGIGQGEWADEKLVSHRVTVTIDLTATKAH